MALGKGDIHCESRTQSSEAEAAVIVDLKIEPLGMHTKPKVDH